MPETSETDFIGASISYSSQHSRIPASQHSSILPDNLRILASKLRQKPFQANLPLPSPCHAPWQWF